MHHRSLFTVSLLALALAAPASAIEITNRTFDQFTVLSLSLPDLDEPWSVETGNLDTGESISIDMPRGKSRLKVYLSQQVYFVFGAANYGKADALWIDYDDNFPGLRAFDSRGRQTGFPALLVNTRGGAGDDKAAIDYNLLVPPADAEDMSATLGLSPDQLAEGWSGRVAFGEAKGTGRIRFDDDGLALTVSGKLGRDTTEKLVKAMERGWPLYVAQQTPGSTGRIMVFERSAEETRFGVADVVAQLQEQAIGKSGKAILASIDSMSSAGQEPFSDFSENPDEDLFWEPGGPDENMLCKLLVLDFAKKTWQLSFAPLSQAEILLDE